MASSRIGRQPIYQLICGPCAVTIPVSLTISTIPIVSIRHLIPSWRILGFQMNDHDCKPLKSADLLEGLGQRLAVAR